MRTKLRGRALDFLEVVGSSPAVLKFFAFLKKGDSMNKAIVEVPMNTLTNMSYALGRKDQALITYAVFTGIIGATLICHYVKTFIKEKKGK